MALTAEIKDFIKLVPAVKGIPSHSVWMTYDEEADTLYINFKKPAEATDSELTDDDVIVRSDTKVKRLWESPSFTPANDRFPFIILQFISVNY